jgi:hypothetical protein
MGIPCVTVRRCGDPKGHVALREIFWMDEAGAIRVQYETKPRGTGYGA